MANILIIDDDKGLRGTLRELLEQAGHAVREAGDGEQGLTLLRAEQFDLALCDWRMPKVTGQQVLEQATAEEALRGIPIVVLTAFGDGESAVDAMRAGAYDFLIKPVDMDQVLSTIARALEHVSLQRSMNRLEAQRFRDEGLTTWADASDEPQLIGRSRLWIDLFKRIGQVVRTDVTVLLQGETGTGKEVIARTIHAKSGRRDGPFIAINCAAIPAELMESELFGHERGAFTGAVGLKIGRFEAAQEGTIFLDEIGELPLALQPKLLRVLQERTFERVGGTKSLRTNVHVLAASNRDLSVEVEEKRFRADLYYRLAGFTLRLPALRERREDILPLAEYFLSRFARRNRAPCPSLAREGVEVLHAYMFPGNVRELEQLMERLAVSSAGRPITASLVSRELDPVDRSMTGDAPPRGLEDLPFHESVRGWEQYLIERALLAAHGNKSEAARKLGVQRRLLYEKLGSQSKQQS